MNRKGKTDVKGWLVALGIIGLCVIAGYAVLNQRSATTQPGQIITTPGGAPVSTGGCPTNPAYTWSFANRYTNAEIVGTSLVKLSNQLAPVSGTAATATSPQLGATFEFTSNALNLSCDKLPGVIECGTHSIVTKCGQKSIPTLSVINTAGTGTTLTNFSVGVGTAATNVTIADNGIANLKAQYSSTAKAPFLDFGGCLVVEYPATTSITSISGHGISNLVNCPYKVTYTLIGGNGDSNTYSSFAIPAGFDSDGIGDYKDITIQLTAGSTNPIGQAYLSFYPAGYYQANDGSISMGVEKEKNQDTTLVASNPLRAGFGII